MARTWNNACIKENKMETLGKVWNFVVNPPAEVVSATSDYVVSIGRCVLEASATYGAAVIDVARGLLGG